MGIVAGHTSCGFIMIHMHGGYQTGHNVSTGLTGETRGNPKQNFIVGEITDRLFIDTCPRYQQLTIRGEGFAVSRTNPTSSKRWGMD